MVRFAFPIRPDWTIDLRACGAATTIYFGNSTYLVSASGLETITSCKAAKLMDWAGPFLTTDRVSPQTLREAAELGERKYELQFLPAVMNGAVAARLPAGVEVIETSQVVPGGPVAMVVKADRTALDDLVDTNAELLTILPWYPAQLSDQRQGHIIARIVNDITGIPVIDPANGKPPYRDWLTGRGLNTATNQQTVAVFDSGYDDGIIPPATLDQHPDLMNLPRLIGGRNYVSGGDPDVVADTRGHGTMVAGIISGKGASPSYPSIDLQAFYRGEGIAPQTKLVAIKIFGSLDLPGNPNNCLIDSTAVTALGLAPAFDFARRNADNTADLSLIANHSWNGLVASKYDSRAQLMDQRVIDAHNPNDGVLHPMTVVVTAGNTGPAADSVCTPGTAKNVITVGSTQSWRPFDADAPQACAVGSTEAATDPSVVSSFSARGWNFGPGTSVQAWETRVKPDLVAPGGRVYSTVPYQNDGTTGDTYRCATLCHKYYPLGVGSYYTYAEGTSFAAPVVAGAAALARKWLLDRWVWLYGAAPSLVKAALIATADDLPNNGDHRPSNDQGWGRVNIERLTDSIPKFALTEDPGMAVRTGDVIEFNALIANGSKPTFITLVWSDPPSDIASGNSQFNLKNDIGLAMTDDLDRYWYGNVFNEWFPGVDDGYSLMYDHIHLMVPDDSKNTVEAIFIPQNTFATGAKLTLWVTGKSVTTASPQKWSLFIYNAISNY